MIQLLPHQVEAREWLRARRRAYLADGPRTGKTFPAVLAAADVIRESGATVVVVCPASVVAVWERAFEALAPGLQREIMSYDMFRRHGVMALPTVMILDEAHRVKSMEAKITRTLLPIAARVPYVWCLSGTPMPNHPGELYTVVRALWPEILQGLGIARYSDWLTRFTVWTDGDYGPRIWRTRNEELFRTEIGEKIMLRRIAVTPPPIAVVPLSVSVAIDEVTESEALLAVLAESWVSGPLATVRRIVGLAKAPVVARLIDEEAPCKRVLFAYHIDVMDELERALKAKGWKVWRIDGSTPARQRDAIRLEWAASGHPKSLFLGQIDACKEGIDLSAGNVLDIMEPSWVPGANSQAAMRVLRVDSCDTTGKQVRFLMAINTIDGAVLRTLARKEDILKGVDL